MSQEDVFMQVADHFAKIIEVSAGHREKAIAAGFSKDTAEQMAIQIHAALVESLTQSARKK